MLRKATVEMVNGISSVLIIALAGLRFTEKFNESTTDYEASLRDGIFVQPLPLGRSIFPLTLIELLALIHPMGVYVDRLVQI